MSNTAQLPKDIRAHTGVGYRRNQLHHGDCHIAIPRIQCAQFLQRGEPIFNSVARINCPPLERRNVARRARMNDSRFGSDLRRIAKLRPQRRDLPLQCGYLFSRLISRRNGGRFFSP